MRNQTTVERHSGNGGERGRRQQVLGWREDAVMDDRQANGPDLDR